jgi:hypothetical protein
MKQITTTYINDLPCELSSTPSKETLPNTHKITQLILGGNLVIMIISSVMKRNTITLNFIFNKIPENEMKVNFGKKYNIQTLPHNPTHNPPYNPLF